MFWCLLCIARDQAAAEGGGMGMGAIRVEEWDIFPVTVPTRPDLGVGIMVGKWVLPSQGMKSDASSMH